MRSLSRFAALIVTLATLAPDGVGAFSYLDDFALGVDLTRWNPNTNQPLYTLDDTNGDIRMAKPVGGTYTFQTMNMDFLGDLEGDFDISVSFRDASIDRIDGTPGNQIQLNVNMGAQFFGVVRSDELPTGDQIHVWDDSGAWRGTTLTAASFGTLRIVRTGTVVTGYWNGLAIYSKSYNALPAQRVWFSLQNNNTRDATSVTFDDFFVTASGISTAAPEIGNPAMDVTVYPNPFRSQTTLSYTAISAGTYGASVFDVAGRRIATLPPEHESAGPHSRVLGRELFASAPAGIYLVRLESPERNVTVRVVRVE